MGTACLEVRGLKHTVGGRAVLDVSEFKAASGEITVLLGPNGSGKSTLLRILNLLETPTAGRVFVGGEEPAGYADKLETRRRMAMVFQEPLLFAGTVASNVSYGLKARGIPKSEIKERVQRALERLSVDHLTGRSSRELSGGEAQRVSLARALVLEPEVLLLDEPLASLDAPSRDALLDDLHHLLAQSRQTAVYVTHNRGEALALADSVAVMDAGSIVQVGPPEEVFNAPVSETVAELVGVETILSGKVVDALDGLVKVQVGGVVIEAVSADEALDKVYLCLRPEEVTVTSDRYAEESAAPEDSGRSSSARNTFRGEVMKAADQGPIVKLTLDCGFPLVAMVTKQSVREMGLKAGSTVQASFKATAVHMIAR